MSTPGVWRDEKTYTYYRQIHYFKVMHKRNLLMHLSVLGNPSPGYTKIRAHCPDNDDMGVAKMYLSTIKHSTEKRQWGRVYNSRHAEVGRAGRASRCGLGHAHHCQTRCHQRPACVQHSMTVTIRLLETNMQAYQVSLSVDNLVQS